MRMMFTQTNPGSSCVSASNVVLARVVLETCDDCFLLISPIHEIHQDTRLFVYGMTIVPVAGVLSFRGWPTGTEPVPAPALASLCGLFRSLSRRPSPSFTRSDFICFDGAINQRKPLSYRAPCFFAGPASETVLGRGPTRSSVTKLPLASSRLMSFYFVELRTNLGSSVDERQCRKLK